VYEKSKITSLVYARLQVFYRKSPDWWFCRQCHTKRGDAIDFMRFATDCSFQEATERLTQQAWPERKRHTTVQHRGPKMDERKESWFEESAKLLRQHQIALSSSEGADYLRGRGLTPATWATFGLGFAHAPSRDANTDLPAIAMPWYRGGKLTAIRYRFLTPRGKQKITSLPESKFGGVLFGGQGLPEWIHPQLSDSDKGLEQFCTLILCEGEINAMSIWQVAHNTKLHVMSLGSETGQLSAGAVAFAERYGQVIIWMDKEELAKKLMGQIPGAYGFSSPQGKDANDMLQAGTLGGQLVALRWQAARSDEERSGLFYDLFDATNDSDDGLDDSSVAAYRKLCDRLCRPFQLVAIRPGAWVTPQRMTVAV
jgi:hypothetical protein